MKMKAGVFSAASFHGLMMFLLFKSGLAKHTGQLRMLRALHSAEELATITYVDHPLTLL